MADGVMIEEKKKVLILLSSLGENSGVSLRYLKHSKLRSGLGANQGAAFSNIPRIKGHIGSSYDPPSVMW